MYDGQSDAISVHDIANASYFLFSFSLVYHHIIFGIHFILERVRKSVRDEITINQYQHSNNYG